MVPTSYSWKRIFVLVTSSLKLISVLFDHSIFFEIEVFCDPVKAMSILVASALWLEVSS